MDIQALYEKIRDLSYNLRRGLGNTMNHTPFIEQTKNVLYNNLGAIEEALKFAADADKQIKVLTVEVESADAELKEKDDEIKALKEAADKPVGKRRKLPVVEDGVE